MDLQRLNWKVLGLTLVFALLTGIAYFVSEGSRTSQEETRASLINAVEEAVDRVCLSAGRHAEDLSRNAFVRQLLLKQIKPGEFTIAANSGNGEVRIWNAEGEEWREGEFVPSTPPLANERLLFFTRDGRGLAAGITKPVRSEEGETLPVGFVGVFGLLGESDFAFANWGLTLETSEGERLLTVPPQINIPTETMAYAVTDGRGNTAALARIEIPQGHPALALTSIFRALTLIALSLFVLGTLAQFLIVLFGKRSS